MAKRRSILIYAFLSRLYNHEDAIIDAAEQYCLRRSNHGLQELHRQFYRDFQTGFCQRPKVCEKCVKFIFYIALNLFAHRSDVRSTSTHSLTCWR